MEDQDHQDEAEIINGDEQDLQLPRSYDCIFCKRGFTTAQALGGHMNIHRKERAKVKPINNNVTSCKNNKTTTTTESNLSSSSSLPSLRYYKFMDSNSSSNYKLPSSFHGLITPLTFHTALQMSFSSNFARVHGKKKMDEDDQLDLELRLGYN